MNKKRPVNLDVTTIKLPLPAYTSILHRVAGILLFVAMGWALYGLHLSLMSAESFESLKELCSSTPVKLGVWIILSALIYHCVAGIKHLLMDVDIGDGKESGKVGAIVTLVVSAILIILAGGWIWLPV
ncbi:MAG: succinate dehydrogenase, cytochrome b556 subunit [Candidatus Endonucleobacter bathymodioli]|uniref:Succinate dehydrogenase cytochrome b556 subunit n=1 Tax=Candidatus Endonucleibacter bathymodioli TaxID=539814 RepID=A0AA90NKZ9_9GAMM|nr:succinate dehydrogenase, cytochrome b556 subunit [Candidatus Endonucleobacter bathymodioli]